MRLLRTHPMPCPSFTCISVSKLYIYMCVCVRARVCVRERENLNPRLGWIVWHVLGTRQDGAGCSRAATVVYSVPLAGKCGNNLIFFVRGIVLFLSLPQLFFLLIFLVIFLMLTHHWRIYQWIKPIFYGTYTHVVRSSSNKQKALPHFTTGQEKLVDCFLKQLILCIKLYHVVYKCTFLAQGNNAFYSNNTTRHDHYAQAFLSPSSSSSSRFSPLLSCKRLFNEVILLTWTVLPVLAETVAPLRF